MGGQEAQYSEQNTYLPGPDKNDVADFAKSSSANGLNLNLLYQQGVVTRSDNGAVVGQRPNAAVTSVLDAFNAWKTKRDSTNAAHSEYLKLVKDKPGRAGTILVPTTPADQSSPTLIGNSGAKKGLL